MNREQEAEVRNALLGMHSLILQARRGKSAESVLVGIAIELKRAWVNLDGKPIRVQQKVAPPVK